jgi:D-glycero-D-manno-heptose 1,7-bisphosphate phosphatase
MKLIILDRDGVINKESADYIRTPAEWLPIPGSLEAIAALTKAGYTICVATNQSGVGRGFFDLQTLETIHNLLLSKVAEHGGKIFKIYFCPHAPTDDCNCRKPKPGMFAQIANDLNFKMDEFGAHSAIFIGDSKRDIELGLATGCKVFLVTSADGHGEQTLRKLTTAQKDKITIVADLAAATRMILT